MTLPRTFLTADGRRSTFGCCCHPVDTIALSTQNTQREYDYRPLFAVKDEPSVYLEPQCHVEVELQRRDCAQLCVRAEVDSLANFSSFG